MAISSLCIFGTSFCVKAIYEWYDGRLYDVIVVRVVSLALFIGIYSAIDKPNPFRIPPKEIPYLIFRIIAGVISMVGYFYGLKLLPLSKAELFYNINPIFTAILCNILLRESLPPYDLLPVVAAFLGMFIVGF